MAKQQPLVTQHLENIARDALEQYSNVITDYIKGRRGIYALYNDDKLYYVGLASNLRSRLRQHLNDRHGDSWNRFSVYLTITGTHIKELESMLLRIVHPRGNKVKGNFEQSENLKRKFSNDIKKTQQQELARLVGQPKKSKKTTRKAAPSAAAKAAQASKNSKTTKTKPKGRMSGFAPYADQVSVIIGYLNGKWIRARVLKDGTIKVRGERFASPSAAAKAVTGRESNGWTFWHYEQAPEDWVPLKNLRK